MSPGEIPCQARQGGVYTELHGGGHMNFEIKKKSLHLLLILSPNSNLWRW